MNDRQEAAAPDLEAFKSECYWRFVLQARRAEYVRRSDGRVLDTRVMTREEVSRETLKPGTKQLARGEAPMPPKPIAERQEEKPMREDVRQRAEAEIGHKHLRFTIRKITGQHPKSKAIVADAECECGQMVNDLLSNFTSGRREYCSKRTCPIALREKSGQPTKARKLKAQGRNGGKPTKPPVTTKPDR